MEEILNEYKQVIRSVAGRKYDCMGIYSISIGQKLVYIGKSKDMLNRLANHMNNILNGQQGHKYDIFRQANYRGLDITFEKLYETDDCTDLGYAEGYLIRKYKPCLNYQIPKEDNYLKYDVNRTAKTITLDEILGLC